MERQLGQHGADVNATDQDGNTPLQVPPAGTIRTVPGLRLPEIRLLGLTVSVTRPKDMLALKFEFRNPSVKTSAAGAPQLVRKNREDPAYIIVHFPPST